MAEQCLKIARFNGGKRNSADCGSACACEVPFVADKVEEFVLEDRAADRATEVVFNGLVLLGTRSGGIVTRREILVRVIPVG